MLQLSFVKHHRWYGIYVLTVSVKHHIPDPTSLHALAALARPVQWGCSLRRPHLWKTTFLQQDFSSPGEAMSADV